jgi:toxin ParE1/3/4
MKVLIREAAEADIERAVAWIAKDNPSAAMNAVARISEQINRLEVDSLAEMGRPGRIAGTRELITFPYIIVYRILEELGELHVLAVVHGARRS